MHLALFGIDNEALNLAVNLLVVFLVVVWLALMAWTYFDARRRIEDQFMVWCAVGASAFPFIGTIIYTILRPPEFVEDRRERELEIRAAELRVKQLTEQSCPNCEYPIEKAYLRCPNCHARVKDPCPSCERPIDPRWSLCPYCETPVRREPPKRRPSERRGRERERPRERPSRERERPQRTQAAPAAKKRPAPKREQRPAAEPATRDARGSAGRRQTSARRAKAAEQATEEHSAERGEPTDGAGEGRSRPATKS